MQLLASALPGFRDLRAPLAAGYLWLLLLRIVVEPRFERRPTSGPVASVFNLADAVNPLLIGIAVSLGAYLVGSISQILSPAIRFGTRRLIQIFAYFIAGKLFMGYARVVVGFAVWKHRLSTRTMATPAYPIAASARGVGEFVADKILRPPPDVSDNLALKQLLWDGDSRLREEERANRIDEDMYKLLSQKLLGEYHQAVSQLDADLSLPATLLVGDDNPALFSETDRLKAEGELRLTLVPPILALIVTAAMAYGWVWLLTILPLLIIAVQGMDREQKSRELMDSAARQKKISPRSIEDFRAYVESDRLFNQE
ncbi:MAG: hypothetical protein AB1925_09260 [Actinomycetota bacterium]